VLLALFAGITAFAQKQNVYYMKDNGRQVVTSDSAYYARIISEPDSGSKLYNVKEFYRDNQLKMVAKSSDIGPGRLEFEGILVSFYPNGKKHEVANYTHGLYDGDVYVYYPDGKLQSVRHISYKDAAPEMPNITFKICNDTAGKALLTNGNGYYMGYSDNFKQIVEEGPVKSGKRDGNWKGVVDIDGVAVPYTEVYRGGRLVSGKATTKEGNTYPYIWRSLPPQYKGGIDFLIVFFKAHINPSKKFVGGRVYLKLIVEKDGSVLDPQVESAPNDEMAAEAIRVIKLIPYWIPGSKYGVPARVQFYVPVYF